MNVMVLANPVNVRGTREVLFSKNGDHFTTLDGNDENYFYDMGYRPVYTKEFNALSPVYFRILGAALAEKIMLLPLAQYTMNIKERDDTFRKYHTMATELIHVQSRINEDLHLSAVIHEMANLSLKNAS